MAACDRAAYIGVRVVQQPRVCPRTIVETHFVSVGMQLSIRRRSGDGSENASANLYVHVYCSKKKLIKMYR